MKNIIRTTLQAVRALKNYFYYRIFPPKYIITKKFKNKFGRDIDWNNPKDINEKIQWLKFNADTEKWTTLSDKYRVREYISSKGLDSILVNLYGVWENVDDIDFSKLPEKFVLKTNHGSGDVIIVKNKNSVQEYQVRKALKKAMGDKFGLEHVEYHYLKIKPCIIAEELLPIDDDTYTSSLVDYKIWCFNGAPYCIFVVVNRTKESAEMAVYDRNWNILPYAYGNNKHFKHRIKPIPRPNNLDKMLDIAKTLSAGFSQVRVDLYESKSKVYFGELTFTSNGGFMDYFSKEYLTELGNQIIIKGNERTQ